MTHTDMMGRAAVPSEDRLQSGFFARQIRTNFRNLCRMVGFDEARAIAAEILASEADRRAS